MFPFNQAEMISDSRRESSKVVAFTWDQNMHQYLWPRSLLEAPKWVKDPGNGLKSIRGSWRDHFGGISGVLDTFRGL